MWILKKKKNDVSSENPIEFIAKECTGELNGFFAPFFYSIDLFCAISANI